MSEIPIDSQSQYAHHFADDASWLTLPGKSEGRWISTRKVLRREV